MKKGYSGLIAAALLLLLVPVASAATSRTSSSFKYQGRTITAKTATAKDLVCAEGLPGTTVARCFANGRQADRKLAPLVGAARTPARKQMAAGDTYWCWVPEYMSLWQDADFGGWELRVYNRQVWYDLAAAYDNQASSYAMGNHGGHIASEKYVNGLGYYYPGPTGYGQCDGHMSGYAYKDTTWNNKASSRYRN